jgi:hypothetical protein
MSLAFAMVGGGGLVLHHERTKAGQHEERGRFAGNQPVSACAADPEVRRVEY